MLISINVIDQIRQSSAVNKANVVYYAAEGALEKGLLTNLSQGAGYNTSGNQTVLFNGDPECLGKANQTDCNTCCDQFYPYQVNDPGSLINQNFSACNVACTNYCDSFSCKTANVVPVKSTFTVKGTVPISKTIGGYYTIPSPGTGDAAANCDPLKMDVSKTQFYYSKSALPNYVFSDTKPGTAYTGPFYTVDHPCNWNKLGEGESVSIPLYVVYNSDPSSQGITGCYNPFGSTTWICNPEQLGLTELVLKVRTPCKAGNGEMCTYDKRYILDINNGDPQYSYDDPVVSWNITASDYMNNNQYLLNAITKVNTYLQRIEYPQSTIISEKLIYQKSSPSFGFKVLTQSMNGLDLNNCQGSILDFLTNNGSSIVSGSCDITSFSWANNHLNKPVLKVLVISSLMDYDNPGKKVPYLEYQVLFKSNKSTIVSPTNAYQTISSESTSGSFRQILEVKVPQESGLLEYVVQQ